MRSAHLALLGEKTLRPLVVGEECRRHTREDHRNVVAPAVLVRELDQLTRRHFERGALLVDDAVHDLGVDHVGQSVGAQQIAAANKGIYEAAQTRPECAGMGTTIVAAVFHGSRVSIAHIGDSRCYRLRGDRFEQLTRDHSLLQEQIDSGQITADQARFSLNKNLVTRALGIEAIVPADISEYRVEPDDIYLLCSDGLTDMVDTDVVHGIVDEQRATLDGAATQLIELANQNGGRDNISVILARVPQSFLPDRKWAEAYLAKRQHKAI